MPGLDLRLRLWLRPRRGTGETGNKQEPFVYGSLGGEDVALVPGRCGFFTARDVQEERDPRSWRSIPDGFYASLAKLQLDKILRRGNAVSPRPKKPGRRNRRVRLAAEAPRSTQQARPRPRPGCRGARVAAEKAKQLAQDQAAAAEQKRVVAEPPPPTTLPPRAPSPPPSLPLPTSRSPLPRPPRGRRSPT